MMRGFNLVSVSNYKLFFVNCIFTDENCTVSDTSEIAVDETLIEIVDGLIVLYNSTAHKQLGKVGSFVKFTDST